jgi:hypothetical protein
VVVHRDAEFLFAPEVLFGPPDAYVPEKELGLLQFACRNVAQASAMPNIGLYRMNKFGPHLYRCWALVIRHHIKHARSPIT